MRMTSSSGAGSGTHYFFEEEFQCAIGGDLGAELKNRIGFVPW